MRFAISAVTAASGLFLLGLAFYGQPAVYLQEAREEWNALVDRQPAEQVADADRGALDESVPEAQRPLSAGQPAAKFAMVPSPTLPAPEVTPQLPYAAPQQVPSVAPQVAPVARPIPPAPASMTPSREAQTLPAAPKAASANPAPLQAPASPPGATQYTSPLATAQQPQPSPAEQTSPPPVAAPQAAPATAAAQPAVPTMLVPDHHEAVSTASVPPGTDPRKAEPAKAQPTRPEPAQTETARSAPAKTEGSKAEPAQTDTARSEPGRTEVAKTESGRSEAASKAAQRSKIALSPPPPPPLPQASSSRQDTEDAQSVLARLRQLGPPPAPPQQADVPPQPEPRARPVSSPTLPRLTAARVALASGRIENARRLLQEAQLQLVFRPIDSPGEDLPTASKGAADVAHALEALSANDVPMSRQYVDLAVDDLAGTATTASVQQTDRRSAGYAPGYAPAYPPR